MAKINEWFRSIMNGYYPVVHFWFWFEGIKNEIETALATDSFTFIIDELIEM